MKKIITLILSATLIIIGSISQTLAQPIEIDCGDDLIIYDGIDIQFLNVDRTTPHTVTVIGLDSYDAVLAVFNQQQNGGCNDNSVNASGYILDFPTTGFANENQFNAQMIFQNGDFMRVVVGEYEDFAGEFVLMVEGLTYDGNPDLINVIVTDDMIQSSLPLTAYVIEQSEGLNLSLALVDDNGVPLRDNLSELVECDDAGDIDLCWGSHTLLGESFTDISGTIEMSPTLISPMLSVPLTADDEQTIVPFQIKQSPLADQEAIGEYVFLLHVGVGELFLADGIATATNSAQGTTLACDDNTWLDDAIDITIPRVDAEYNVSLLGQNITNPVLAVMDSLGGGLCYTLAIDNDLMGATLPTLAPIETSEGVIRTNISTETARILTGVGDDTDGSYLMAIEGLSISPDDPSDVVSIQVTEQMVASGLPVSAFIISETANLNPQLLLVSAEGDILTDANDLPIICFDTSSPNLCWGTYDDMATAHATLGYEKTIQGTTQDVMLRIPLTPDLIGTTLNFMANGVDETFGEYTLLIHLPMGTSVTNQ